jgi:hypothetical protein
MCPECYATIALLVTGAISTGGVTQAAVTLLRRKKIAPRIPQASDPSVSAFARANTETKEREP